MTTGISDAEFIEKRARLVDLLQQAAELEHGVMCQYIFAAVSMKKTHDEGDVSWADLEKMRVWRGQIMMVAREEMEHLGLVLNLLTAVGEAPVLTRRDFPFSVSYRGLGQELTLERFSLASMIRFALIEMPEHLPEDSEAWHTLAALVPDFSPARFDLIAQLYDEVADLIGRLPEDRLFIGPPEAQFTTSDVFPGAIRGIPPSAMAKKPAYNVSMRAVRDRASALAVVDQIREEGEGAKEHGGPTGPGPDDPPSHFEVFMTILEELRQGDADASLARPVVANPTLEGDEASRITHPATRKVMALFDACYETLILALMRYFAHTDESQDDLDALQQASFFPMMTTVIRPLSECLTLLPAKVSGPATAGPSFVLPPGLRFLPHRDAAFKLLSRRYDAMVEMAHELSVLAGTEPNLHPLAERLTQVYETLWRSRLNLRRKAGLVNDDA